MSPSQGLNGSMHAPRSASGGLGNSTHAPPSANTASNSSVPGSTNASSVLNFNSPPKKDIGIKGSVYSPIDIPKFKFGPLPLASGASTVSPPNSQALTLRDDDPATIQVPNRQSNEKSSTCSRRDLCLAPVYLVGVSTALPHFSIDKVLLQHTGDGLVFYVGTLAAGIAQGCSLTALRHYLDYFPRRDVEMKMRCLVQGRHPVLFYAAERNCVECVRLLLDYGCEADVCDAGGVPVLAFAIMRSKWTVLNPAEVVKMLLAFGAGPHTIPRDMWSSYLNSPSFRAPSESEEPEPAITWCTKYHRNILALTLNLSIRYYLHKSSQLVITRGRGMQMAQAHGFTALLKVPYLIIGQDFATKHVVNLVATHLAMKRKEPLVLTFAGLSGHGKTELAKQMGGLLQVPTTVIDCAQMHSDIALFGSRLGYQGNAQGSQLNNHLAEYAGVSSVVFLDEFDKTDKSIHNSLLLVLDSGEYHDRRNNNLVDASKTIWIMATNLGDVQIKRFYRNHLEGASPSEKARVQHEELQEELKEVYRNKFGAPIAGRMKNIAPFYPFNFNEQAVVAHKFLLELVEKVREPINTSELVKDYIGHVHLAIKNDGKLCAHIAKKSYIEDLGARSLTSGIEDVRVGFYTCFTDTDELVSEEMNDGPLMRYTVQLQPLSGGEGIGPTVTKVAVAKDGYSNYYKGQGSEDEDHDEDMTDGVDELDESFAKMMNGKIR